MRNIKMIAGLAAFAVMALACGTGTEVTTGGGATGDPAVDKDHKPVAVPIGQKITVNTDGLAATYTLSKAETRSRDEFGSKPENGTWLAAFLRVDVTKGETFACSCELSLVQKDGKVRDQAYASFDNRPEFESVDLKAGQNADGWVMWDLPKSAVNGAKVQLKISSLFDDSAYGYWTVKV